MPSRAPDPLPLFPLSTVLFPGGRLPLRIFEPRYLDLIGRCHRQGQPFGVVALQKGREVRVAGAPEEELHDVGTLAYVRWLKTLQPGLLLIECRGAQRFRIQQRERLPHGLWTAEVQWLENDRPMTVPHELQAAAGGLRQLLDRLAEDGVHPALPDFEEADFDDCGWLANRWAELLPLSTVHKQQLMSLDNPLLRLELVVDWLQDAEQLRPPF